MEQFSHKLANMFYDANIISSDAVENYAYAIESLIVKVIGWSVLLCLAFVTGWFKECYAIWSSLLRLEHMEVDFIANHCEGVC